MTGRDWRFLLYTFLLCVWLRACTPWDEYMVGTVEGAAQQDTRTAAQQDTLPEPTIEVEVSPRFTLLRVGQGTASVLFRVTVPRNPQNRVLCVGIDGTMYRLSCMTHGPSGQYRQEFPYRSLPAGDYVAFGELQWVDAAKGERKTSVSRFEFRIIGGE